jgi:hypothetical protein
MRNRALSLVIAVCAFIGLTFGAARKAEAISEIFMITGDGTLWSLETIPGTGGWTTWVELGNVGNITLGGGGGTATGGTVAGGTALGTIGILAAAVAIAVGATIAIDCYANGECIWTTVSNAGGWGVVTGWSPNPNAAPIPGAVTVNCSDPTPLATQCRNSSLQNVITSYDSCPWCSYWTCGQIWANGSTSGSADWMAALNSCNNQLQNCVASTSNVCIANGINRPDLRVMALNAGGCGAGSGATAMACATAE